jgi:Tfp pilus assembly protein PilF
MMRPLMAMLMASLVAGCASEPVRGVHAMFQSKGEQALAAGLRQYEGGDYVEAQKSLQSALEAGLGPKDHVNARKHLAFIHCASGRQAQCREEFRKALEIDPRLELAPAEAGHPSWGPVFRAVKAARR